MSSSSSSSSKIYSWADLPKELLEIIGKRLETRIDVFRFRAICNSWRSVVPLSFRSSHHSPPVLLPPPVNATTLLSPITICRLEDESRNSACLIKVVESTSGEMQLLNPLTQTPPHEFRKSLNIINSRLIELGKGCRLNYKRSLRKTVLFGEHGVLAIYNVGKLGYFGFGDENWTILGIEEAHYDDIVVHKGQFYVVDSLGIISWVHTKSMNLVQYSPPLCGLGQLKNLVVSEESLFVVDSYFDDIQMARPKFFERVDMKVYKLDEEWGTWVEVTSLGDRVFVLGKEVCLSASVKDFPDCEGNCIYFIDRKARNYVTEELRHRHVPRVFKFDDQSFKTVTCSPNHLRLFSPSMNFSFSTQSSP